MVRSGPALSTNCSSLKWADGSERVQGGAGTEPLAIIHASALIDTSFRIPRPDYLLEVNGVLQSNLSFILVRGSTSPIEGKRGERSLVFRELVFACGEDVRRDKGTTLHEG